MKLVAFLSVNIPHFLFMSPLSQSGDCIWKAARLRVEWYVIGTVVPVGSSKREEMHIMNASATSRRMSGAQQQAGLLRARLVRQSEYASKGSTSIAT